MPIDRGDGGARAHAKIPEDLFLVAKLQSWHTNLSSRQIKSAKPYKR